MFLNACRNNPFTCENTQGLSVSTGRGLDRVLARIVSETAGARKEAHGIFVDYSTSPSATASDGNGDLNAFTAVFVKAVKTPGFSIQRALSEVSRSVGEETDWSQTPWIKLSLTNEIMLNGALTFEEALSASKNHAAESKPLLATGDVQGAIVEAFRRLPQQIDETTAVQYPSAYQALTAAARSSSIALSVPDDSIRVVIVNVDGSRAVVLSVDNKYRGVGKGALEIWDTGAKRVIGALGEVGTAVPSVKFSADGSRVAAYLGKGVTTIAYTRTGQTIATITLSAKDLGPTYGGFTMPILVFSEDGASLVGTLYKKGAALVQGWDVASGARRFEFDLVSRYNGLTDTAGWTLGRGSAVLSADGTSTSFVCTNKNAPKLIALGRWSMSRDILIGSGVVSVDKEIYPIAFGFSPNGSADGRYRNGQRRTLSDPRPGYADRTQIGQVATGLYSSFSPTGEFYSVVHQARATIYAATNGERIDEMTDYAYTVPAAFQNTARSSPTTSFSTTICPR